MGLRWGLETGRGKKRAEVSEELGIEGSRTDLKCAKNKRPANDGSMQILQLVSIVFHARASPECVARCKVRLRDMAISGPKVIPQRGSEPVGTTTRDRRAPLKGSVQFSEATWNRRGSH